MAGELEGSEPAFTPDVNDATTQDQPEVQINFGERPSEWMGQLNKASNVLLNSGVVAALRVWFNPPRLPEAADMSSANVPSWFADEYQGKTRARLMGQQFVRDTLAFTFACYALEGVEALMRMARGGQQDHWNKVMGGVTAGGLLSFVWYPGNQQARVVMTCTGAAVGYLSYLTETASNKLLLDTQQKLEKDVLHKRDSDVKQQLDTWYLRQLFRVKQQQVLQEQQQATQQQMQRYGHQERPQLLPAAAAVVADDKLYKDAWGDQTSDDGVLVINEEQDPK